MSVNHILIPRRSLFRKLLLVWLGMAGIACVWRGLFIFVALLLSALLGYYIVALGKLWKKYFRLFWYIAAMVVGVVIAVAVRLGLYRLLAYGGIYL